MPRSRESAALLLLALAAVSCARPDTAARPSKDRMDIELNRLRVRLGDAPVCDDDHSEVDVPIDLTNLGSKPLNFGDFADAFQFVVDGRKIHVCADQVFGEKTVPPRGAVSVLVRIPTALEPGRHEVLLSYESNYVHVCDLLVIKITESIESNTIAFEVSGTVEKK